MTIPCLAMSETLRNWLGCFIAWLPPIAIWLDLVEGSAKLLSLTLAPVLTLFLILGAYESWRAKRRENKRAEKDDR